MSVQFYKLQIKVNLAVSQIPVSECLGNNCYDSYGDAMIFKVTK